MTLITNGIDETIYMTNRVLPLLFDLADPFDSRPVISVNRFSDRATSSHDETFNSISSTKLILSPTLLLDEAFTAAKPLIP